MFSDSTQVTHSVVTPATFVRDQVHDILPIKALSTPLASGSAIQQMQLLEGVLLRFERDYSVLVQRLLNNEENSKSIQVELNSTQRKDINSINP